MKTKILLKLLQHLNIKKLRLTKKKKENHPQFLILRNRIVIVFILSGSIFDSEESTAKIEIEKMGKKVSRIYRNCPRKRLSPTSIYRTTPKASIHSRSTYRATSKNTT